jgi:hypothetical protein
MNRAFTPAKLILPVLLVLALAVSTGGCRRSVKPVETNTETATLSGAGYSGTLSEDQIKIVESLGRPKQFILTYVPLDRADGPALSRMEVWFYPDHRRKITFMAGLIFDTEEMEDAGGDTTYSDLRIEDFNLDMSYRDVVEVLGDQTVVPIDFVRDVFAEDEVESYLADKVIFTIEQDRLIYMQTLGVKR